MAKRFVSLSCQGERCYCGEHATNKVEETVFWDDPVQTRHPLTAYLCAEHFDQIMGAPAEENVAGAWLRAALLFFGFLCLSALLVNGVLKLLGL